MNMMIPKVDISWTKPTSRGKKPLENCHYDDHEKPSDINNSTCTYNMISDHSSIMSTKYYRNRVCKRESFGECDIVMMKHRLGISHIVRTGTKSNGQPININKLTVASIALQRELLRCLGSEGAMGGKSDNK